MTHRGERIRESFDCQAVAATSSNDVAKSELRARLTCFNEVRGGSPQFGAIYCEYANKRFSSEACGLCLIWNACSNIPLKDRDGGKAAEIRNLDQTSNVERSLFHDLLRDWSCLAKTKSEFHHLPNVKKQK